MIKRKKPNNKSRYDYEDDDYEDENEEEDESEDYEDDDETEDSDEEEGTEADSESDDEHPKRTKASGGKQLNVQWLEKMESNQRKLEKKIDQLASQPNQIQEMITETITDTLSNMSLFRIAPKTNQPNKKKLPQKGNPVDQKVVKTEPPVRKPLLSRRKK